MKRYRFLLLAFFLANNVHGGGGISGISSSMNVAPNVIANVNSTPDIKSAKKADIKKISPRNTAELGSVIEPVVLGSRMPDNPLINGNGRSMATKTIKTSSNSLSCKTYEGQTYDQGEPGYSDCMRNIKTDRQGTRNVP